MLEVVVSDVIDRTDVALTLFAGLGASAVSLLGTIFLSGFLRQLVGGQGNGGDRVSIRSVAAALPWRRLILADLLVVLLVVIGTLALIIPGLAAFSLLALVGPVIEIENKPVLKALRTSARLVRPHFWTVSLLVLPPMLLASAIESIIPHPDTPGMILAAIATRGIGEGIVEAAIGLVLVELCLRLLALDHADPAPGPADPELIAPDA